MFTHYIAAYHPPPWLHDLPIVRLFLQSVGPQSLPHHGPCKEVICDLVTSQRIVLTVCPECLDEDGLRHLESTAVRDGIGGRSRRSRLGPSAKI